MENNLMADSAVYSDKADLYDRFSRAEDADGKVLDVLLPLVRGRRVLDAGCGTGKYLELLSPYAASITGVDISEGQLAIAAQKAADLRNVTLFQSDIADMPVPAEKYDVVMAAWAVGTILDDAHKTRALDRMAACVRPGGRIVLIENDEGGTFEDIRGRVDDPAARTATYNRFLTGAGFEIAHRFTAFFRFTSLADARTVLGGIWGDIAAAKVTMPSIEHRIVIFTKQT